MAKWKKQKLKLQDNHGWDAPPGYRIFVADRGAVRFNFPQEWTIKPDSDSVKLYDKEPPADDCVLAVSYLTLPPIDWTGLPLSQLVQVVLDEDSRDVLRKGQITSLARQKLELAWAEVYFVDPNEHRGAFSRICIGREKNIQSLITFDFWADDAPRLHPVWDEVLRSLELGRFIKDPTRGM